MTSLNEAEKESWPVPPLASETQDAIERSLVDLRRMGLTQLGVLLERTESMPFLKSCTAVAVLIAAIYFQVVLPGMMAFGNTEWQTAVKAGDVEARAGGAAADVNWMTPILLSCLYVTLVILGVRWMERRPPVTLFVFEAMLAYNAVQVLLNLYSAFAIAFEVSRLGFRLWGYEPDASPEGYALGRLIWLQYHCKQLELMDTFFMVARKKFQSVSALHMYMRVLSLWGWFFACRFACGGDTYFPAIVNSLSQLVQYSYFSLTLLGMGQDHWKQLVTRVQISQYVVCTVHNLFVGIYGHLPRSLALLHSLVTISGIALYTNFHYQEEEIKKNKEGMKRVTFSFDSAGWLYIYHFGVATWIQEHMTPGISQDNVETEMPSGLGFSGSSAGALTALLLASGTPVPDIFEHVLEQYPISSKSPRMMPVFAEAALRKYQFANAYKVLTGRLRILVTRVLMRPPFFMGEVIDEFESTESAIQWLLASCHIPIIFGLLPRIVQGKSYYDGLMWSSLLVPWRGAADDQIIRVSAIGSPLADIQAPLLPMWWSIYPPPPRVLRGLYWRGYADAAKFFSVKPAPPLLETLTTCGGRMARAHPKGAAASPQASVANGGESPEMKKWRAATEYLRKMPQDEAEAIPTFDEAAGETVSALIKDFESAVSRRHHVALLAVFAMLPLAAVMYLPARNAVLSVVLAVSVAFTLSVA